MNNRPVTVHTLSHITQRQVQPSDFDTDTEDATLLSRGRAIARVACRATGWQTPGTTSRGSHWQEGFLRNAFTYLHPPPLVLTTAGPTVDELKEWNTHPSESETYSTADLQPFESVPFCSPHPRPNVRNVAVPVEDRNRRWSVGSSQPPTKRMKVEVDTGPLDELIPLPHYVPAPLKPLQPALLHASLASDTYSSFAPIPPQTTSSIGALLSSTYSRVAWLIPVRGLPPWEGVSRASVALPVGHPSVPGPGRSSSCDIVWTHSSLRQFWTFLKSCSEMPSGSVTGPLSLSFHTAPRLAPTGSQQRAMSPAASAYLPANRETEMTPSDPSPPPIRIAKTRLTDIDYIKVYCDAPRAMLVRQALSRWAYEEGGYSEGPRAPAEAIRVLEFSKLALVNERGEGVLVS
ncbi:hypothetical protein BJV78DRAFT_1199395 [Lactifluus subvellereus]|nr:hypothetical protein BJV78DRAFT_1199395 [Lactifluus subvellereus]